MPGAGVLDDDDHLVAGGAHAHPRVGAVGGVREDVVEQDVDQLAEVVVGQAHQRRAARRPQLDDRSSRRPWSSASGEPEGDPLGHHRGDLGGGRAARRAPPAGPRATTSSMLRCRSST